MRDALVGVIHCQTVFVQFDGVEQVFPHVFQVLVLDDLRRVVRHEGLLPAVEEALPLRQDALTVVLALGEERRDEGLTVVGVVLRCKLVQPPVTKNEKYSWQRGEKKRKEKKNNKREKERSDE